MALRDDLTLILGAGDPKFVRFIEGRGRGVFLRAAPIDVADIVRDTVVGGRAATVLTSATLAVESSFDYVLGRLGLPDARTILLPSEFDFRTQSVLFLPTEMPDPRSPDFNRAAAWVIGELLDRTQGRAFVLFTSYGAMREVLKVRLEHWGYPVHVAEDAATAQKLVARHSPDIVITDVVMPGMSGIDLLRALRADSPSRQIVLITAHASVDAAVEGLLALLPGPQGV